MDLGSEERDLGRWPRRLLYVPTLTSYAWQPGNIYNDIAEPEYNAITYTWGRWRLRETIGQAIDIRFEHEEDGWPIPCVSPTHFKVEQFEHIIRMAVQTSLDEPDEDAVRFIWLDIACIDQRGGPKSDAEIGRQAVIFQGAKRVFAWLTTQGQTNQCLENDGSFETYDRSISMMESLLSDPWFSSLWTLQEAFLRNDTYLLDSEGEFYRLLTLDGQAYPIYPPTLKGLTRTCVDFVQSRSSATPLLQELVDKAGLKALDVNQEIAVYLVAKHRTTSNLDDRVYGIQQIFGLRLGKTAARHAIKSFSLSELELQLGEQLLRRYPVHSQMHTFVRHVPPGRRWRIHIDSVPLERGSLITGQSIMSGIQDNVTAQYDVRTSFDVDDESDWTGMRAVRWSGPTIPLATLQHRWDGLQHKIHFRCPYPGLEEELGLGGPSTQGHNPIFIALDNVDETSTPNDRVLVLLLGFSMASVDSHLPYKDGMYGLLLVHRQDEQWTRIGVCQWSHAINWRSPWLGLEKRDVDFLRGCGEEWVHAQGIFGYAE